MSEDERQLLIEFERRGLRLDQGTRYSRWCPQHPTPKQQEFLDATELEVLYGGALGGAKTSAILMAALQYVDDPGYSALIIRKTFPDLRQAGGLIPRSHEWLAGTGAQWNDQWKQWRFPSGATLSFGYCDGPHDHLRYHGGEYQFIGVDEAGHIPLFQLTYLTTRLRRPQGSTIPLRFRLTANPGGESHEALKERYIESQSPDRRFIPSLLSDNPHLDVDSYREQLESLDPLQRAQLLDGDWSAVPVGIFCSPDDFRFCDEADLPPFIRYFRCWDIALSPVGDWSVGVLMARTKTDFYVLDVVRHRLDAAPLKQLILDTATRDPKGTLIGIETANQGLGIVQDLRFNFEFQVYDDASFKKTKELTIPLYSRKPPLIGVSVAGRNKLERISGFLERLRDQQVVLVRGGWNSAFISEFCNFTASPSNVDDQIDATSIAFMLAMRTRGSVVEDETVDYKSDQWFQRLREDIKDQRRQHSMTDGAEVY